jgi:hypothetical protein
MGSNSRFASFEKLFESKHKSEMYKIASSFCGKTDLDVVEYKEKTMIGVIKWTLVSVFEVLECQSN